MEVSLAHLEGYDLIPEVVELSKKQIYSTLYIDYICYIRHLCLNIVDDTLKAA
jgi:hypothetical protein